MLLCDDPTLPCLQTLLAPYALRVVRAADDQPIPGSFWGDSEAGLVGDALWVRRDTPVHSALHEAAHYVCMDEARRARLHTDAGGDTQEENGVCYLQILWADALAVADSGRARMCADMDAWGYSFRLGSAARWFSEDADDARVWLLRHRLIDAADRPTWRKRR